MLHKSNFFSSLGCKLNDVYTSIYVHIHMHIYILFFIFIYEEVPKCSPSDKEALPKNMNKNLMFDQILGSEWRGEITFEPTLILITISRDELIKISFWKKWITLNRILNLDKFHVHWSPRQSLETFQGKLFHLIILFHFILKIQHKKKTSIYLKIFQLVKSLIQCLFSVFICSFHIW